MLWEELYLASPKSQKVILTIRESDEKWWKSWCGFMIQESERGSFCGFGVAFLFNYWELFCHFKRVSLENTTENI